MLLLGVALATLFHKLVTPEVADEYLVLVPYMEHNARRVTFINRCLGVEASYPHLAPLEVHISTVLGCFFCIFVSYPGWSSLFCHKRSLPIR